jgi:hypothetical protein
MVLWVASSQEPNTRRKVNDSTFLLDGIAKQMHETIGKIKASFMFKYISKAHFPMELITTQ